MKPKPPPKPVIVSATATAATAVTVVTQQPAAQLEVALRQRDADGSVSAPSAWVAVVPPPVPPPTPPPPPQVVSVTPRILGQGQPGLVLSVNQSVARDGEMGACYAMGPTGSTITLWRGDEIRTVPLPDVPGATCYQPTLTFSQSGGLLWFWSAPSRAGYLAPSYAFQPSDPPVARVWRVLDDLSLLPLDPVQPWIGDHYVNGPILDLGDGRVLVSAWELPTTPMNAATLRLARLNLDGSISMLEPRVVDHTSTYTSGGGRLALARHPGGRIFAANNGDSSHRIQLGVLDPDTLAWRSWTDNISDDRALGPESEMPNLAFVPNGDRLRLAFQNREYKIFSQPSEPQFRKGAHVTLLDLDATGSIVGVQTMADDYVERVYGLSLLAPDVVVARPYSVDPTFSTVAVRRLGTPWVVLGATGASMQAPSAGDTVVLGVAPATLTRYVVA